MKLKFLKNIIGKKVGDIVEVESITLNSYLYKDDLYLGNKDHLVHLDKGLEGVIFERVEDDDHAS